MSGERAPLPTGGNGAFRGSRTRSYGSLVQSTRSPVRQGLLEHRVQPGETLQGLALKYGVSMEQIKRVNRLYTNDSIFLKTALSIPVLPGPDACSNMEAAAQERPEHSCGAAPSEDAGKLQDDAEEATSDLSPGDFLKRMDGLISQCKQAAVKGCQEGEKRFAALEAACTSRTPDRRRATSAASSPGMHQHAAQVAVPLTITKRTMKLREREDEIFEL